MLRHDQSRLTVAFPVRELRVPLSFDGLYLNEEIRINVSDGHAPHHCYHFFRPTRHSIIDFVS